MVRRRGGGAVVAEDLVSAQEREMRWHNSCLSTVSSPFPVRQHVAEDDLSCAHCTWKHQQCRSSCKEPDVGQADTNTTQVVKWKQMAAGKGANCCQGQPIWAGGNECYLVELGCDVSCECLVITTHGEHGNLLLQTPWVGILDWLLSWAELEAGAKLLFHELLRGPWGAVAMQHELQEFIFPETHWIMQRRAAGLQPALCICVPLYPSEEAQGFFQSHH